MTAKTKKGRKTATVFEKPDAAAPVAQDAPAPEPTQDTTPAPTPDTPPPVAADAPPAPKRGRKPKAEPDPAAAAAATGFTMADLATRYIEALRLAGKGLGTQFSYSIDLAVAVKHFGPESEVASLTTRKVQNYFESDAVLKTRSGRGKAKPGIDKTRRVLRLALVWAAEQGLITEAPIPESAKPRAKKAGTEEAA